MSRMVANGSACWESMSLRVAVGVRGGVATFEMHLVRPESIELQQEVLIETDHTVISYIRLGHPALNPFGIKLFIPRRVERICEIDSPPIATELNHLRSTVEGLPRPARMGLAADDSTDFD